MSYSVKTLRRNCIWQREKGTVRDNGYPYYKHVPDCDICQAADHIEEMDRRVRWYEQRVPFVLSEEGFSEHEIDDLMERLTPYNP